MIVLGEGTFCVQDTHCEQWVSPEVHTLTTSTPDIHPSVHTHIYKERERDRDRESYIMHIYLLQKGLCKKEFLIHYDSKIY